MTEDHEIDPADLPGAELPDGIEPEGWAHGHPDGRVVAHGLVFNDEGDVVGAQMLAYLAPRGAITSHGDDTGQTLKLETPNSEFRRSMYLQCMGRKHLLVTFEVLDDEQLAQYQEHKRQQGEDASQGSIKGRRRHKRAGFLDPATSSYPDAHANGNPAGGASLAPAAGGGRPRRRIIQSDPSV